MHLLARWRMSPGLMRWRSLMHWHVLHLEISRPDSVRLYPLKRGGNLHAAGTTTRFYNGNDGREIGDIAWFRGNSDGMTHPVGQKKPNGLELYDMLGNVAEWCRDFPDDYPSSPKSDWTGVHNREFRVTKGGSWKTVSLSGLWCALYAAIPPESTRPWFGFRVCVCR